MILETATDVSYDEAAQRVTLTFAEEVLPTSKAVLEVKYNGIMNNALAGFYRSKYKPVVPAAESVPRDTEWRYMFSTQFASCDCRRALPCYDEPNLKATFDFEIEIPNDQTALSNMPEKGVRDGKKGRKIVSFEKTPIMSTYLLAWAFGDFEYVEDFTKRKYNGKPLPVRVYTTRGLKEQGQFAVGYAPRVMDYFSEIFQIDYPLPKVDLLAVHEFSYGAMENWGLVTYRTTAVLFDEATSDAKYKFRVAGIVAHELAHQWFGNLVTMDWWSELWLNEGFATWVGWFAVDHLYPDFNIWAQSIIDASESAFQLDSLRASHPIEVPVKNALEIGQIFDAISYMKGSCVIRMLSGHLGVEAFLQGVSEYLKAHAYGNATTKDLWAALSKASGKDVSTFMDTWIRKIGFPVLTVAEEPGQISVRQKRFLSTGDVKPEEDTTLWWIPLGLLQESAAGDTKLALTAKEETLRNVDETFYKLNANQTGFYRTNYPAERLVKLGRARAKLSAEDRIGLVGDAAALAVAGEGTTAGLLALCAEFTEETNMFVWAQVVKSLSHIQSIFAGNGEIEAGLKKYVLQLVTPATEKIGWEFALKEDILTGRLRSLLIDTAGGAGHEAYVANLKC
jgi:aminopeptidase N